MMKKSVSSNIRIYVIIIHKQTFYEHRGVILNLPEKSIIWIVAILSKMRK